MSEPKRQPRKAKLPPCNLDPVTLGMHVAHLKLAVEALGVVEVKRLLEILARK